MDVVGPVPITINQRYAITIKNFSVEDARATKVHAGAFGNFGTSQGALRNIAGSFLVAIPETGLEFDFDAEFTPSGKISVKLPVGAFGMRAVKINKQALAVQQEEGTTTYTVNFTAETRDPL